MNIGIDKLYGYKFYNPENCMKIVYEPFPWYERLWYTVTYYAPYVLIFSIGFLLNFAILLLFFYMESKL
jgi:hypothetical protein